MADDHLIERCTGSQPLLDGHFLKARRDDVALPDGRATTREYIVHPGAVAIVPLLDDRRVLLERQYRYPLQQVLLEIPAGKIDPGESAAMTAVRELREETGYTAAEWAHAGTLHNAAAYSTEHIEIWFAPALLPCDPHFDPAELLELVVPSADQRARLAATGGLTDAKTLIGLLWLQRWRAGAWSLEWRDAATMSS